MHEHIAQARHIALIAHVHPDADSLGSACAMYAHLLRLEKKMTLFCATKPFNPRLEALPWAEKATDRWDGRADLAIAFDCGAYARLGVEPSCTLINIDHHGSNDGFGQIQMIDTAAVSTTMVLYRWFLSESITLNAKMATALYAGLAHDSMAFMGKRSDAAVFEMAAALSRAGADVNGINTALFLRDSLCAWRLKGMMYAALDLRCSGRIALLLVDADMLERSGGDLEACERVLHETLGLPTVKAALLLCEGSRGRLKGALRTDEGINMATIAAKFGGGGHRFAAGFETGEYAMADLADLVVEFIEKELL